MPSDRRLTFYSAPARQGFRAGALAWLGYWLLIAAIIFTTSIFISFFIWEDPGCDIDPYAHGSSLEGRPICSTAYTLQVNGVIVALALVALGLAIILLLLQVAFPDRWLALAVTPGGLASSYARYAHPVIGWAEIESLGFYEAPPDKAHKRSIRYFTITVRSPEELRDSEAIRLAWSVYPTMPDMDRMALVWPIGRVLDSGGSRPKLDTIIARIDEEFGRELAENHIDVFTARPL